MAAKKRSASKQVTITVDEEMLEKLVGALQVLAEAGNVVQMGVSDEKARARLTKKAAKKSKKRA